MDRNYDLTEVGGDVYLIDRSSGSVYLKQDGEFVAVVERTAPDPEQLSQVRTFGPVNLPPKPDGSVTVNGRYKYLNGTLRYILNVTVTLPETSTPEEGEDLDSASGKGGAFLMNNYDSLALRFLDKDGFEVVAKDIALQGDGEMRPRIVGEEGTTTSYSFEGRLPLGAADYLAISAESISWREAKPLSVQNPSGTGLP